MKETGGKGHLAGCLSTHGRSKELGPRRHLSKGIGNCTFSTVVRFSNRFVLFLDCDSLRLKYWSASCFCGSGSLSSASGAG